MGLAAVAVDMEFSMEALVAVAGLAVVAAVVEGQRTRRKKGVVVDMADLVGVVVDQDFGWVKGAVAALVAVVVAAAVGF
jgi:hypothetical protein